jgi:UDP-GlcNAc:undecaprenyl-phosphate GlcNAc-1-phosphate transferase
MARIGFSQRKTVAYLYGWTLLLAGVALALRFVPYSVHHNGRQHYQAGWLALMIALGILAIAASAYLVYVLEIFRFKARRTREIRRDEPDTAEHEIVQRVTSELETGEFERVGTEKTDQSAGPPPAGRGPVPDQSAEPPPDRRGPMPEQSAAPSPRRRGPVRDRETDEFETVRGG